ncbi:hypothetical protein MCOR20_011191 [Pyricularia oryzae]|nr:hypothetical protein MCOR20_011191 [Pyricularia oryzae]
MGEGKSSVIVPLVVFLLADGTQLVRVIVAKPQSKQMLQMLLAKLGGLLDVHVFQLPFSRALRLDPAKVNNIAADLNRCMRKDGILLRPIDYSPGRWRFVQDVMDVVRDVAPSVA